MKYSTTRFSTVKWLSLTALLFSCWTASVLARPDLQELTLLVPAERGGGWDLTARAIATTLQENGSVAAVKIEYSPGAGGLIGLAQFIASKRGVGNALVVGGMFTVGAVGPHRAAISLLDTSPLARLTWDSAVVVVPATSTIRTADDLLEALLSAPGSVSWVGGSKGGVDEMIVLEIARKLGVAPSRLHYTPLPGGGEVGAALAAGSYTAGISGYSEVEELVVEGRLRVVAVTSAAQLPEISAADFKALGIPIERLNWRGVFAPPGINAEQLATLTRVIKRMAKSSEWQQQLSKHHWQDAYLDGPEFVEFVQAEQERAALDFSKNTNIESPASDVVGSILLRRYLWALGLGILAMMLVVIMLYQRSLARHREEGLQHAFEAATGEANLRTEELEKALAGIHAQIEHEFDKWGLTSAERDIALLMLKGLRLKDIAAARGTSERTVRQQAQAVYKKAGLDGRSDLAAYFIEDFMQSMDLKHEAKPH